MTLLYLSWKFACICLAVFSLAFCDDAGGDVKLDRVVSDEVNMLLCSVLFYWRSELGKRVGICRDIV